MLSIAGAFRWDPAYKVAFAHTPAINHLRFSFIPNHQSDVFSIPYIWLLTVNVYPFMPFDQFTALDSPLLNLSLRLRFKKRLYIFCQHHFV